MANQQLLDYIKQQLQQGKSREQIKSYLIANNWQENDIEEAFSTQKYNSGPYLWIGLCLILLYFFVPFFKFFSVRKLFVQYGFIISYGTIIFFLTNIVILMYLFTNGFKLIKERISLLLISFLPLLLITLYDLLLPSISRFNNIQEYIGNINLVIGLSIAVFYTIYLYGYSLKEQNEGRNYLGIILSIPYLFIYYGLNMFSLEMGFSILFRSIYYFLLLLFISISILSAIKSKNKQFFILSLLNIVIVFIFPRIICLFPKIFRGL